MSQEKKTFKFLSLYNWDDVVPFNAYNGNPSILKLKFDEYYTELMAYFQAILQSGEVSERSYELTGFVISQLASNYNAWELRQKCVEKLNLSLDKELDYIQAISQNNNQKTFQLWDYRRYIINLKNSFDGEIQFIENTLEFDNKNYHLWAYRIWLCQKFNLFQDEFQLVKKYIDEDICNNSAWNYRFFLFFHLFNKKEDIKQLQDEINMVIKYIKMKVDNESTWNYLQGFFKNYEFEILRSSQTQTQENTFSFNYKQFPIVEEQCLEILKKSPKCRFAYSQLIQIYLLDYQDNKEKIKTALGYCEYLQHEIDLIRNNYWAWVRQNIQKDFNELLKD